MAELIPKCNFIFLPKATQSSVTIKLNVANPPKYVQIYQNKCSPSESEMQDDRAPWISALIASLIQTVDLQMSAISAKKNVQMQTKVSYHNNFVLVSMIIPPQISLVLKALTIIKKVLHPSLINNAYNCLKFNKKYVKEQDKEDLKKKMEQVLVSSEIQVITKQGPKTDNNAFLTALKEKSDAKLKITALTHKQTPLQIPVLTDVHKQGYIHNKIRFENQFAKLLLICALQDSHIDYFVDMNHLYIKQSQLNNQVFTQIKNFMKLKVGDVGPKKLKNVDLLNRKKTDIAQYVYSQHAMLYKAEELQDLELLPKMNQKQFDSLPDILKMNYQ